MNDEKQKPAEVTTNEQLRLAKATQQLNNATLNMNRAYQQPTIGRNEICSCGSGKKSKYCCGAAVQQAVMTIKSLKYIKKKARYLQKKGIKEAEAVVEATSHKCKNCKHADHESFDCEIETITNQPPINELNNCSEFGLADIPNETTIAAINELENDGGHETKSVNELFKELNGEGKPDAGQQG